MKMKMTVSDIVLISVLDLNCVLVETDLLLTRGIASPCLERSASENSLASAGSQQYWDNTKGISMVFFNPSPDSDHTQGATIPTLSLKEKNSASSTSANLGSTLGKRSFNYLSGETIVESRNTRPKVSTDPDDPFVLEPANKPSAESDHHEPVFIAFDGSYQIFFDKRELSFGVQWEIARLVSAGRLKYGDIPVAVLDKLKGTNTNAAPQVVRLLLPDAVAKESTQFAAAVKEELQAKAPWTELDKEFAAHQDSPTAGLGCSGSSSWYGGKVHFIGKLKEAGKKDGKHNFTIELDRPELGPSSRFARRFGSHSFLRVNIKKDILNNKNMADDLAAFFYRPFVINGRVYRGLLSKEHSVFLYMTNERVENRRIVSPKDDVDSPGGQMSLLRFLNWHNPLKENQNQTVVKWAARFALGFSNSVPGLKLEAEHIHTIDDQASESWDGMGKLPSELDMTDGCGVANAPLLKRLREVFEWEAYPTAVQCRLGGAKGLILLHPLGRYNDTQTIPEAYVRPSQIKIKYAEGEPLDEAMLIVDVLRSSKMKTPARLSAETIINLAENGVKASSFVKLMHDGLEELVRGLTTWDGQNAMESLFYKVAKVGGVMGARMARELGGKSRAMGFGQIEDDNDDEDDEDDLQIDPALQQRSTAWWDDQISGQPSSLQETVMVLLASGFHPRTCSVLAAKLENVLGTAVDSYVKRYKIDVGMSCEAFIVPDPYGVLEDGEIHIKIQGSGMGASSFLGEDMLPTDVVRGKVLVTRHPCKVPTDIQKVTAVERPELRQFCNVIIFSTKGKRSLASMLGGGDYDGDKVIAIWQPEIVKNFRNADVSYANPPEGLNKCFVQNTETVKELLQRVPPTTDYDAHVHELQTFLLGSLKNQSAVGNYSVMHDNAVYEHGYFDERTKRLAYMFCACLDGSKTGLVIDPEVYKKDLQEFKDKKGKGPEWKAKPKDANRDGDNSIHLKRPSNMHSFIMDVCKKQGLAKSRELMQRYKDLLKPYATGKYDEDLAAVYFEAKEHAEEVQKMGCVGKMEELERIVAHVNRVRIQHRDMLKLGSPRKGRANVGFTNLKIEARQDMLRALSKEFVSEPTGLIFFSASDVRRVRASYAYYHDWEEMSKRSCERWTRFPWDVSMRDLCEIKAKAIGYEKTITRSFYDKMNIVQFARVAR
ncbi:RNA dependent RNA polymerase-domain-containing protein [Phellopilus nigrolimitatus]|nr:RNA dependent RNA polymerase-domain-containing protein [Phellopilus nigrolimitatus]